MSTTIAERVAAGAALLDERMPGWVEQIDLNELSLRSPCHCVLGQIFGRYGLGIDALDMPRLQDAVDLGFEAGPSQYDTLTDVWRALIRERRAATTSPAKPTLSTPTTTGEPER